IDPTSGLPVLINRTIKSTAVPKEVVSNFLTTPTTNFELLSLIFKAREAGGNGSFPFSENGENYVATFAAGRLDKLGGKVRTDAGEFDTTPTIIQSTYLDLFGIKNFRLDLSNDQFRIPVRMRFDTGKGSFTVLLASVRVDEPPVSMDSALVTQPQPTSQPTPRPAPTPRPVPTPTPFIDNQPLLREVKFVIGETLDYRVMQGSQAIGTIRLAAKERKQAENADSLLLSATVLQILPGNRAFGAADSLITRVNPDTLAPQSAEFRLSQGLAALSQRLSVNGSTGAIAFGAGTADAPVGTHTILSLIYAMRSFHLQASKTNSAPVNDTRVAVFWRDRPYIFVLRPAPPDSITMEGKPIPAQLVAITTGVPELDALQLKVWLSLDDSRIPLRFVAGTYQADLTSASIIAP
ncbi:MAG: DUF3108 domain-containing protein, partial [Blastocatellia bacterium]|nr:DUF3108 domain-containing protein [Blastocatellia bacterium]